MSDIVTATIPIALGVIDKVLGMIPNYDQKQREKFHELREKFENEKKSLDRDDAVVDKLRDDIVRFIEDLSTSISG